MLVLLFGSRVSLEAKILVLRHQLNIQRGNVLIMSQCSANAPLRYVLLSCKDYHNATRTHLSLNKDAPVPRGVEWAGICRPILGGPHIDMARM